MAINSLIAQACDPTTNWYAFTYSLSWSHECEVAEVLSDIPFISVGILAFGASTFFLVTKRVSLSAIWLFFSVLLAFVAAFLDLGRTLADGVAVNATFIASRPTIRAREVLFALSIGFRFLFYWSYAAEPPRKDLSTASGQTIQRINFITLERAREPHSGGWMRWGLPGKLLGIGLLVTIMTITALQIVWRLVPWFHQYSNVYGTDVALELLVSFLLLLRILLNTLTLNLPENTSVHTFRECLAPISGLLVNITIGVGNLLCFAFTESTVGRLLEAFEVYILVVFVVIVALLRHRSILLSTVSSQDIEHRDVVFTLPEPVRGSTFRITIPHIETPRMSTILATAMQHKLSSREMLRRSTRRSLNHVSSWVSSRVSRNRTRCEDEEVRLWNTEKGKLDPPYTRDIDTVLTCSFVSSTQEHRSLSELLRDEPADHMSIASITDARSTGGSVNSGQVLHPQVQTNPASASHAKSARSVVENSESPPVYRLSDIQSIASASESQMSLDELLRHQSQLDQSIEALKLFSARVSTNSLHSNFVTSPRGVNLSRSPSTGQRTVSSEVSLSNFPVPPWLTTPMPSLPSSSPSPMKRIRGSRRARLAAARPRSIQEAHASVPTILSACPADIPSSPYLGSIPHSPLSEEAFSAEARKSSRFNSEGTQYNVTSFIGGLATPSEPGRGSQEKSGSPRESECSTEPVQTSTEAKNHPPRMPLAPGRLDGLLASPTMAKVQPLTCSSRGYAVNESANFVPYRTMAHHALAAAISPHIPRTQHGENAVRERNLPIILRPRPPPLTIQPYIEPTPSLSRIEVLADD